jgi:hypothetical protein
MPFTTMIANISNLLYYRDVNACAQGSKGPTNQEAEMTRGRQSLWETVTQRVAFLCFV